MEDKKIRIYDLEERLIQFALDIISQVEQLPNTKVGTHIGGQLLRCGTSPAFNYGEAQDAESKVDFVHKMKVCLKELRETRVCIKIILRKPLTGNSVFTEKLLKECGELILIFSKSISTAKSNRG